jgi:hypothetical protein
VQDVRIAELAGRQFNRVSRRQLNAIGVSDRAIDHRVVTGRLVIAGEGVFAVAPALEHDDWGRWMGATLTSPASFLCRESAARALGVLTFERDRVTVARPGSGGPRQLSGVIVYRSTTLAGETTTLRGIPITAPPRTLLDLACCVSDRALAKALRDSVRLKLVTVYALSDWLGERSKRRGSARLTKALARYHGLPIERARSGAEVRALEVLRDAGQALPRLNVNVAGEEADLSWPEARLIIEIDGGPFHLDVGEDARKEAAWRSSGWTVLRLDADDVYDRPDRLVELAKPRGRTNVPRST